MGQTIEEMFQKVGVKTVFDKNGHFTSEAMSSYDKVATQFFDGNIDALDQICEEEKCF